MVCEKFPFVNFQIQFPKAKRKINKCYEVAIVGRDRGGTFWEHETMCMCVCMLLIKLVMRKRKIEAKPILEES